MGWGCYRILPERLVFHIEKEEGDYGPGSTEVWGDIGR